MLKNIQKKILNKYSFFEKVSLFYKRRKNRKKKFLDEVTTASVWLPQRGCPRLLSFFFTFFVSLHYINHHEKPILTFFNIVGLYYKLNLVTPWLSATYTAFYFIFLHKYSPWNIKTYYKVIDVIISYIITFNILNII